jgi:uncharacterized protein (TIGR02996 family)
MTHEHAFLEAILDDPDDEGLRLIFADWLEEQGQPRGEFIRTQCTLAGLPADDRRRRALEARERQLLARHRDEWLGPLRSLAYLWGFRRGFAEEVTLPAESFLDHGDTFFRSTPVLLARLLNSAGDPRLEKLAHSPYLGRLTALHLTDNRIGNAGLVTLLDAADLGRLTTLRLGNNELGDTGMQALAECPHLTGLTTLNLQKNGIGNAGAYALAMSPHLGGLTALYLGDNQIGPAGAQALAESPYLRRLDTLELANSGGYYPYTNSIGPKHRGLLRERFGAGVCVF